MYRGLINLSSTKMWGYPLCPKDYRIFQVTQLTTTVLDEITSTYNEFINLSFFPYCVSSLLSVIYVKARRCQNYNDVQVKYIRYTPTHTHIFHLP